MKKFVKRVPAQIASTYTIMLLCFTVISLSRGVETMPFVLLPELFILAVVGGILMEFAFGECIFKKLSDMKRVCIFIVPFAVITFGLAVFFQWITELNTLGTYLKFIGIFMGCWALSVVLFEIEHRIKGREYTRKLREYQEKERSNA